MDPSSRQRSIPNIYSIVIAVKVSTRPIIIFTQGCHFSLWLEGGEILSFFTKVDVVAAGGIAKCRRRQWWGFGGGVPSPKKILQT